MIMCFRISGVHGDHDDHGVRSDAHDDLRDDPRDDHRTGRGAQKVRRHGVRGDAPFRDASHAPCASSRASHACKLPFPFSRAP